MPRVAKDDSKLVENKKAKNTVASNKKTTSKTTTAKTKTKVATTRTKKTSSTTKAKETKASNKATPSKSTKEAKITKTTSSKKTVKNTKNTKSKKVEILEYYDLPNNYHTTTVKILAQTPTTLFVYWDISDEDKENYIKTYGEFFFNDTKPVLIVYNKTMNYSFEVEINDFANSWYLHVNDSNCDYSVELGRRPINNYSKIDDYLYISESNNLESPNDRILFDSLTNNVYFRNVKTNVTTKKDISVSFLTKLGKIYNIKEFYKKMYKDENIDFDKLNLKNMSSS